MLLLILSWEQMPGKDQAASVSICADSVLDKGTELFS